METRVRTEKIFEKHEPRELAKIAAKKGIYAICGYLAGIASLPFGALPFGFALLGAANANAVFVYLGLAISCFFGVSQSASVLLLGIYTAQLLLRSLVRLTLDCPFDKKAPPAEIFRSMLTEHRSYRVISAALAAFSFGACVLIGGGFLYYDLFSLLLCTAVAPLGAYLFWGAFEREGTAREIGILCIAAAAVLGAAPLKVYGVSVAVFIAMLLTLGASRERGFIRGVITGATLGLVYSPTLAPIFIFSAVCMTVFSKISTTLACTTAFLSGVGWGFFVKGISALDGIFAGVLSACVIYSVCIKLRADGAATKKSADAAATEKTERSRGCAVLSVGELDAVRLFEINRRSSASVEAIERLGDFFARMKIKFPKKAELLDICEDAFASSCAGCAEYGECGQDGRLDGVVRDIADALEREGRIGAANFGSEILKKCARLPDIIDEINYNSGARRSADIRSYEEKLVPDLRMISRILERNMQSEDYEIDEALSERVCGALAKTDAELVGALVYGSRRRSVYIKGKSYDGLMDRKEEIFEKLCVALPFNVEYSDIAIRRCADGAALVAPEASTLRVSFVKRRVRAKGESEFCGDSVALFENEDNRFYSLISDGMGSGRRASAVSGICTRFMAYMLKVGSMSEELCVMLNGFLCERNTQSGEECSATLDLFELDTITGEATFYKSGAAPSYVLRGGNLFKIRSCSMPIGILERADTKKTKITLERGDAVVMMSDGVTGGRDECPWLFDLLKRNIESAPLGRTADLIMKYARTYGSEDDVSVVIVRIE